MVESAKLFMYKMDSIHIGKTALIFVIIINLVHTFVTSVQEMEKRKLFTKRDMIIVDLFLLKIFCWKTGHQFQVGFKWNIYQSQTITVLKNCAYVSHLKSKDPLQYYINSHFILKRLFWKYEREKSVFEFNMSAYTF